MKHRHVYVQQMGALYRLSWPRYKRMLKAIIAGTENSIESFGGVLLAVEGDDFHHITDWSAEDAQDALAQLIPATPPLAPPHGRPREG